MSRLIDADALKSKIEQSGGEGTIARYCKRVLVECLDNDVPTIPAIPIDWMDAQIRGYASALKSTELKALMVVKRLWEKEQEAHGT